MSRTKKKRVAPPKRIRYKDKHIISGIGSVMLKALEDAGLERGTPEAEAFLIALIEAIPVAGDQP